MHSILLTLQRIYRRIGTLLTKRTPAYAKAACLSCDTHRKLRWVYRTSFVLLTVISATSVTIALANDPEVGENSSVELASLQKAVDVQQTPPSIDMMAVVPEEKEKETEETKTLLSHVTNENMYAGLPVGTIEVSEVEDAKGIVVFLPQYHKSPGSHIDDSKNDKAVITQTQTHDILNTLMQELPIEAVVVEGERVDDVNNEKQQALTQLVAEEARLEQLNQSFAQSFPQEIRLQQQLQQVEQKVERHIALAGAPQWLAASGASLEILGAEDPETQAESKVIVRNHLYLQDRLASVKRPTQFSLRQQLLSASISLDDLKVLMENQQGKVSSAGSVSQQLATLAQSASGKDKVLLQDIQQVLQDLQEGIGQFEMAQASRQAPAPSRSDNPFQHISDPNELQRRMKENEADLHEVILERRNKETAMHTKTYMDQEGMNVIALQFGAAHKIGLIEELNAQGLNVVTVVPDVVEKHHELY